MANKTTYEIQAKTKGFKQSDNQVKGLKKSLGGLKTAALGVAGAYFGGQALIGGIRASIEAFGEQEAAEKKLEQALGRTSDRLLAQASALQKVSTSGDEAIIAQQAFLGSIGMTEQQIEKILPVALDLASATGMTLESAVRNTAKTFSGLAGELGELVPQIRDLTAEEMKAGKAVEVMGNLFKGQALSSTKTFEGQVVQLQNAMGDIGETIGGLLVDNGVLSGLVEWATEADEAFRFFFGTVKNKGKDLKPFQNEIDHLNEKIEEAKRYSSEWAEKAEDEDFIRAKATLRLEKQAEALGDYNHLSFNEQDILNKMIEVQDTLNDSKDRELQQLEEFIVLKEETEQKQKDEIERVKENKELIEDTIPVLRETTAVLSEELEPAQTLLTESLDEYLKRTGEVKNDLGKIVEMTDAQLKSYQALLMAKKVGAGIEVMANANVAGSFSALNDAMGGSAELSKNLTIAQAFADAYSGSARAFRDHAAPASFAIAASVIATGLATAINTQNAYNQKFEEGGLVGGMRHSQGGTIIEAEQGEYVMNRNAVESIGVDTLEAMNETGGGGVTVNISGNVMTDDFVENELAEKIASAVRRGTDFGIS
jgi:hypothetical protein